MVKTDLEKFKELYEQIQINHWIETSEDKIYFYIGDYYMHTGTVGKVYKNNRIDGYTGFYCCIKFTEQGDFLEQGFWE